MVLVLLATSVVGRVAFAGSGSGSGGGALIPLGAPQSEEVRIKTSEPITVTLAQAGGASDKDGFIHRFPGDPMVLRYDVHNSADSSHIVELIPSISGDIPMPLWDLQRYTTSAEDFAETPDGKVYLFVRGRTTSMGAPDPRVSMTVYWPKDANVAEMPHASVILSAPRTNCAQVQTCATEIAVEQQISLIEETLRGDGLSLKQRGELGAQLESVKQALKELRQQQP